MSYPFSSLSTVSFTKDMLPGSFTLKQTEGNNIKLLSQSAGAITLTSLNDKLTFSRSKQSNRQPARKRREIGEPCAKQTSPLLTVFYLSSLFFPPPRCLQAQQQQKQPLSQTVDTDAQIRVNPLIAPSPKKQNRRKSLEVEKGLDKKKVSSSQLIESDMKYGLTSPPPTWILAPLFFARLWLCKMKRLLHSGAEAHIDEEGAQGCCCCWWRWRHSACSNERRSPTLTHCKKTHHIPTSGCSMVCTLIYYLSFLRYFGEICQQGTVTLSFSSFSCWLTCL